MTTKKVLERINSDKRTDKDLIVLYEKIINNTNYTEDEKSLLITAI